MLLGDTDTMRFLDEQAESRYGLSTAVLMENAGLAVARRVAELLGEDLFRPAALAGKRVVVFAGPGNNGGDGMAAARHLALAGAQVRVLLFGRAERLRGATLANYRALPAFGVEVQEQPAPGEDRQTAAGEGTGSPAAGGEPAALADVVVDALLGTGSRLPLSPLLRRATSAINRSGRPVVSVDVPTGVDAQSGEVDPQAVQATSTVTFGLLKPGLLLYPGAARCGEVILEPISLPVEAILTRRPPMELVTPELLAEFVGPREPDTHKGTYGRVLIVAGSRGMVGAGRLAAEGALRAGAGLTVLAMPASLLVGLAAALPDCLTLPLPEAEDGRWGRGAAEAVLAEAARSDSVVIGPGIGQSETVAHELRQVLTGLAQRQTPLVLDADGLNLLAGSTGPSSPLAALLPPGRAVFTPHPGELARLLSSTRAVEEGWGAKEVQGNRIRAAQEAARQFRQTVVLKGAHTIIAEPDGRIWFNPTGNPGMATGGTGDVLAGMIGAFLAQGLAPEAAAKLGVYLHGMAGDLAAAALGEAALTASDVAAWLGAARRQLEASRERREHPWRRRPLARWYLDHGDGAGLQDRGEGPGRGRWR